MQTPDIDPRYLTAEGCLAMAREMDAKAHSAELLVKRHQGWARALRSRSKKIDEAETLELEARAARMKADGVGNQPRKDDNDDPLEWMFGKAFSSLHA